MNTLHHPTPDEQRLAIGMYQYDYANGPSTAEEWELSRLSDGSYIWRSARPDGTGELLSHLLLNHERRPDRLELRWGQSGVTPQLAVYTFFDDYVTIAQHGEHTTIDLPPDTTLMAPDVGSRALMLPPLDWEARAPEIAMVYTIQRRGNSFWNKPVKWAFAPLGTQIFTVGGQPMGARGVHMSVPGLPEATAWFTQDGIPALWEEAGWKATLTKYQSW